MTKIYDLEERTFKFGKDILILAQKSPRTFVTMPLLDQLIRSGTSVGSNYCEADCAESRRDFEHKLSICKKESKETTHWLRMLTVAVPEMSGIIEPLLKESCELKLIFISIIRKSKS